MPAKIAQEQKIKSRETHGFLFVSTLNQEALAGASFVSGTYSNFLARAWESGSGLTYFDTRLARRETAIRDNSIWWLPVISIVIMKDVSGDRVTPER